MIRSLALGSLKNKAVQSVSIALYTALALGAPTSDRILGQLIDLSCYSQNKDDTGNHHVGKGSTCAQACAREGFEVGLLTSDGKVYHVRGTLASNSNARLVPYISKSVAITGVLTVKNQQATIDSDSLEELR